MSDIITNSYNIKIKTIKYNEKDGEILIKDIPILGWKLNDTVIIGEYATEAIPIIPTIIDKNADVFFEWNNKVYDKLWNPRSYEDIKNDLIPKNTS